MGRPLITRLGHGWLVALTDPHGQQRQYRAFPTKFVMDDGVTYLHGWDVEVLVDSKGARADYHPYWRDLRESGLVVPDVRTYFETLLRYCVESNWGKKRLS